MRMKIAVLVKHVPDPDATWSFAPDLTLDRAAVEGRLSELDEYAVEQAVRLVEGGLDAEIVCVTVGPAGAADSLRKALAMGADSAVHVLDDHMHGSDALATSLVLAAALERTGFDLVLTGMGSTDAEMSVMPAMVAERLGVPQATFAGELAVSDGTVSIRRETDTAVEQVSAALPAVVSVTDRTGETRYPAFRAIMLAKKKPVSTWSLGDLGVDAARVGLAASATRVVATQPAPARAAGVLVTDDGTGASQLADYLAARGLL
jgi:electron transfer flavoprotein beta subunit